MLPVRLDARVVRRLRTAAHEVGVGFSQPGPCGTLDSLAEWVAAHGGDESMWLTAPLPAEPPLPRAQTVAPDGIAVFEAALAQYQTLSDMRAAMAEVAVLSSGQLVGRDGLVMTADRLVARESAWADANLRTSGVMSRRLPRAQVVDGAAASLVSQWCSEYFHWMTDTLPRLRILELVGEAETPLVLPAKLASWQQRSLELLGVNQQRCYRYRAEALRIERLVWPRPAAVTGHIPAWACEWLRTRLAPSHADKTRRLYVTRNRERWRRVANEAELRACLADHGFETIDPGTLPLDEQIVAFSEAAIVVGPHGGGLTNVLFGHDGAVIELFEPTYVNPCFYALASRSNHAYWYIVGQTDGAHDIVIDTHLVEETLGEIDARY